MSVASVEESVRGLPLNYTGGRDEIASLFGVHPNSVSRWFAAGKIRWDSNRGPNKKDRRASRKQLIAFLETHWLGNGVKS